MNRRTINSLISELRALSGIVNQVSHEEVDWYVKRNTIECNGLERLIREVSNIEEAEVNSAQRETLKGIIEGLGDRIYGLVSLLDNSNKSSLGTALEKIIEDANELLIKIKPEKEKQDNKKQEKDNAEKTANLDDREANNSSVSVEKDRQSVVKDTQQATVSKQSAQQKEDIVCIGGEIIMDCNDPFGMGVEFLEEIKLHSGVSKR